MIVESRHRDIKTGEIVITTYDDGQPDPTPASIAAEKDAEADRLATLAVQSTAIDKAMAEVLFEILKAMKSGDMSFFNSVTSKATFRDFLKSLIKANL